MKRILTVTALLMYMSSWGQSTNSIGLFPTVDHSGTISDRFEYSLYYFGGLNLVNSKVNGIEDPANFFVFYAEQALTYRINSHLSFTGSYVYERQRPTQNNCRNENRFYLQSTYKYDLGRTSLKHRLRYDGRFIENRATGETPYTSRLRYLFGVVTPLRKTSDNLYFAAYNELFFNTYKASSTTYSENWAFAGIGIKTPRSGSFEVGPLYIFWVNNAWKDLNNFYYLQLTWLSHLDWRRKK